MADFPRTIKPRFSTVPSVPGPLISVGQSGKTQLRATAQIGRIWTEEWAALRLANTDVEALLAFVETSYRNGTVFDIVHQALPGSGKDPNGAGGGTPLVDGASQTGASLDTKGWTASVTNVVRSGDVIRVAGLNQIFRITADANSDGAGDCTLTIDPPIAAGGSPADSAAITRSGCKIRAVIAAPPQMPTGKLGDILAGLRVTFREAP